MKKTTFATCIISLAAFYLISCSDNKAAEVKVKSTLKKELSTNKSPVKEDGPAVGVIETDIYTMKLHRAFTYSAKGTELLAGFKPKAGYKFIYLDVSLRNKSTEKLEGGFLFIALKLTDDKGVEYKKPAAGLAAYTSEHPNESSQAEYNALWEKFEPGEFHREIIYCVEVPIASKTFVLHMPADNKRKEWKTISFSI
jgi:hypothetical protein